MICLNNTDTLEGGASVNAVVDYTIHGLVGTTFTNLAQGQLSNTDPSVLYTAGAAISVVSIVFVNTHSAAVTVNLYLDPANAGTPRRLIPKTLSLAVGYSMHFDGTRLTIIDTNGGIVSGLNVSDTAYDATSWNGVTTIAPSKNAIRDWIESLGYVPPGSLERAKFIYSTTTAILIDPGAYYLDGKWRRWDSQLTFTFGSGGSNAGNTNLAANDWFYLCLDHSTIGSDTILIASDFIAVTTEPAWNNAKHGQYVGNDRCIFAVRTDGSGNILEFFHYTEYVTWADYILDVNGVDYDTTWVDATLTRPSFSCVVESILWPIFNTDPKVFYWRTNNQSGATGKICTQVNSGTTRAANTLRLTTSSSGIIEFKSGQIGVTTLFVYTSGWYLPKGL